MRTTLYALDGREMGSFQDMADLKWYAAAVNSASAEEVRIDDRYNDDDGDSLEVVCIGGADVATLDRRAPDWFVPLKAPSAG